MSLTPVSNFHQLEMDFCVHVYFNLLAVPFQLMPNIYNYTLQVPPASGTLTFKPSISLSFLARYFCVQTMR